MRNVEKILFWKPEGKKSLKKRGVSKKKIAYKKIKNGEYRSRLYRSKLAFNGRLPIPKQVREFLYQLNVYRPHNKDLYTFVYKNDFKFGLSYIHQNTNCTKDTKFNAYKLFRFSLLTHGVAF
jgi:hypothetical protein